MSSLTASLEQYLTSRRQLGFQLNTSARVLKRFVEFATTERAEHVTVDLVVRWMRAPNRAGPATWASRICIVRGFARWLSSTDPRTEVPPERLLPHRPRRCRPHIYTGAEIRKLLRATAELRSSKGLRAPTYATLFGLVAVTGMRISEAIALDIKDVDLEQGVLTVRRTKFGKTRLVPIHRTTCARLAAYAEQRDRILGATPNPFFVAETGRRVTEWSTRYTFARVCQAVGIRAGADKYKHGRGPRIHDLRHCFAAATLVRWYRAGVDVERGIDKLATYLGHGHATHTYWYIEAVPELLGLATERVAKGGRRP